MNFTDFKAKLNNFITGPCKEETETALTGMGFVKNENIRAELADLAQLALDSGRGAEIPEMIRSGKTADSMRKELMESGGTSPKKQGAHGAGDDFESQMAAAMGLQPTNENPLLADAMKRAQR